MRRLLLVLVVTWGLAPTEAQADTAVTIQTSAYQPKDIVVLAGETVVWTNQDAAGHSVTADDGSFDSSPECGGGGACMEQGEVFQHTFEAAGQYPYYCRLHGGAGGVAMAGTVTVVG